MRGWGGVEEWGGASGAEKRGPEWPYIGGQGGRGSGRRRGILSRSLAPEATARAGAARRGAADLTSINGDATNRGRRSQRRRGLLGHGWSRGVRRRSPWREERESGGGEGSRRSTATRRSLWTRRGGERVEERTNPKGSVAGARWLACQTRDHHVATALPRPT
jgi:hypothetical protein